MIRGSFIQISSINLGMMNIVEVLSNIKNVGIIGMSKIDPRKSKHNIFIYVCRMYC